MKKNKILMPIMMLGTLSLTTACGTDSTNEHKYSYDVEVGTYLEWLDDSTNYYQSVYDLMSVDLPNLKAEEFTKTKDGSYLYQDSISKVMIYTKEDKVSRIEMITDLNKATDEETLERKYLFNVICTTLNPEFYFDLEGTIQSNDFWGQLTQNVVFEDGYLDTFVFHDSDYEVKREGDTLTLIVTSNGMEEFKSEAMDQAKEILKNSNYTEFIEAAYSTLLTGMSDNIKLSIE